jgi:predicted regulator of Ras-like GTPase activity (Roadblock/LC7/MglB family)
MKNMANQYAPLLCSEFKLLAEQLLDGRDSSDVTRARVRAHRSTCEPCCNYHDGLVSVSAIAAEMDPPDEFTTPQSSRLWNKILTSVDLNSAEQKLAASLPLPQDPVVPSTAPSQATLSKLDKSKIDVTAPEDARFFDLAKFLFGPEEMESFNAVLDPSHKNARIERVSQDTLNLLGKLQDVVFDLPTVVGTMVLSPDGSILDSRLAREIRDQPSQDIGVWSIAAYHNAQAAASAFGFNRVTQIVSRTETGFVIIANLQDLTLIVLIDGGEDDAWNAVARLDAIAN